MRPIVPDAETNQFAKLCWLGFPTRYLSRSDTKVAKPMNFFPAASAPGTSFVEIGLTKDTEESLHRLGGDAIKWGLLLYAPISDGLNLFVRWYHGEEEIGDVNIPASHGRPGYRFVYPETDMPDRPVRMHMQNDPADNETLCIIERGGCQVE
ncbi:MAG: hypothetical protein Q7R66_02605 [Undibacterium sp.]|uniref:hypothetical protein n=1 Tax=Undibacterium sp. TaxID=1914977 RepID=UPI002720DA94|nr:hypothetical protein [Undibacterium sp.]MDO8651062.1 hypothetical protein [Undibacterium sp.]